MYIVDEKDREYRFGDSGPKYLMKGPRMILHLFSLCLDRISKLIIIM